ncbi:MAG: AAA family ATPase [Methanobrevibacter sp.]|nr:AAA family ATPase [Methanobrevibacter sp.]
MLKNLNNINIANGNQEVLQEFYNVLKESEKYLKFVFITGISKFTKVSVFSTFNNLTELSLDKDYSNICGIIHAEL